MKVNLSAHFQRSYRKLPRDIKDDFKSTIQVFIKNPRDPRLKTHKLKGKLHESLAFRLKDGYRVLFEFSAPDTVDLLDVGSHDMYERQ